ncbi:small acid-soluble spore protein Tlp [Virgibacillus sp. W0430]|uniref:small acid-soluble spore protein Tlp n=1 Tax=Virgibacillus sp. W0430 TaxID=3391580 RepID=UPI003F48D881
MKSKGGLSLPDNRHKPDDRSDNKEKLQNMVHNTLENIAEAEDSMEFASGEQKENIRNKNQRRKESIESMRNEIKDESEYSDY